MVYSVIGIITIAINVIINRDVFIQRTDPSEASAKKAYRFFIYGILAYLTTDALWGICDALDNPILLYIDTILYYIAMYYAVLLWTKYVVTYLDDNGAFSKLLLIVGNILMVFELTALLLNHMVHFFFWVDEAGDYHAYAFRYIALVAQIILFLSTSIYAFTRRMKIEGESIRKRHIAIGVFGISMSIAIIVQMFYPLLPIYSMGYMVGTCLLHTYVIEDENLELKRKADEANMAKTSFLFNMSHDIRTPMNAIIGFTNMAIKQIDDKEKALDALSKSQQAENILLTLINSVLEVSRIESGNAVLEEQCGDVYYSFANIESTMRELAEVKDIEISFEIDNIKDRYVYCDFSRCASVLVNVISNSIKYTREGGFVRVRCEQIGEEKDGYGTYCYSVSDNGVGMDEEFQKHVYEQFARERTTTVSGVEGTGLGMAVCKSFVDLMGGSIECISKKGEGTTFKIILPFKLQQGELYTDPDTGEVVSPSAKAEPARGVDFAGKRVLLAEDNILNREIAVAILEEKGLIVDQTEDGQAAVDKIKENGPDYYNCILMDIQMPRMNGYEATKAIREMYPDDHIPIIALSANAFSEDKRVSLDCGMDDHVAKPINIKELFNAIGKFI